MNAFALVAVLAALIALAVVVARRERERQRREAWRSTLAPLTAAFRDLQRTMGEQLLPAIRSLASDMADFAATHFGTSEETET